MPGNLLMGLCMGSMNFLHGDMVISGTAARIQPAVMSYCTIRPSYPLVGSNTLPKKNLKPFYNMY